MRIGRYYRQAWAPEGVDPDILEKSFGSKLEPDAQKAFERLLRRSKDFTDEETAAILVYLEMQRVRVPRQAAVAKQLLMSTILLNSPPNVAAAIVKGDIRIKINDGFRFDFMRMLIGKFHPYFERMEWQIVEAENGCGFITSDSPVTFYNMEFVPPAEPGLGLLGTMVFFPVNSRYLLVMRHPEYQGQERNVATDRIPDPKSEDVKICVTYGLVWNEKQVNLQNWLMFQLADRLVVGASKVLLEKAVGNAISGH